MTTISRLIRDEDGADATEYALLASLIAVALIGGASLLGGRINEVFSSLRGRLVDAPAA